MGGVSRRGLLQVQHLSRRRERHVVLHQRTRRRHLIRGRQVPAKGTYRWQVEAYNDEQVKLAESDRDIKFTIN